jgi:glyoxylase-like metal-dependent hydrolase (beta-lactamase superfamily II)
VYLKGLYPDAKTGIGSRITEVQETFSSVFNLSDLPADGSQFDVLFDDGDEFSLGSVACRVIHTPGHTPACVCYVMGDAVFAGDTIFMPDFGTARCDFPSGSSADLYDSVTRGLYGTLDDGARVFVGHDYQPGGRELQFETTIGEEKRSNKQLNANTSKDEFVALRSERDGALGMPNLILPSLQVNLRGGRMPTPESNGVSYLKIPVNLIGRKK